MDGFDRLHSLLHFGLDRKVHHEDSVFLDDADEQDEADNGDHREFGFCEHESEERADTRGWNRGKNSDGVNETLVENAENDVHGRQRSDDQYQHRGLRILKSLGGSLKSAVNGGRHAKFALQVLDFDDGVAERAAGTKVEGQSDRRIKALVVDGERSIGMFVVCERTEWNNSARTGGNIDLMKTFRALRVFVGNLEDYVVLVEAFVNIRDLALAKGITERIVDVDHGDAQA